MIKEMEQKKISVFESYGQLVRLGFAITDFTPVAYQRSSLLRSLKENLS